MRHEIKLRKRIQLAGLLVNIKSSDAVVKELKERRLFGSCGYTDKDRYFIKLDPTVSGRKFSESVCHEFFEAINTIYLDGELKHREVSGLGRGFHQILEQLGIRFVKEK